MNWRFACWASAGADHNAIRTVTRRKKRVNKDHPSSVERLRRGRCLAALALVAVLAACGDAPPPVGTVGHVQGFGGMVAADEPRAALVARDVLSAGGNAADAATALYYTLAVTLPSTASLGGGGACVVHDVPTRTTEILDFPARPSTEAAPVPSAVPANPRGFFALHAKYGRLRFESLLAEPERLARSGIPVSRALATDLARVGGQIRDPAMRALFLRPDGTPLREGDRLVQPELAMVIANLRHNTGDFYVGRLARELVGSVQRAGGALSLNDLRDLRPLWREGLKVAVGDEVAYFPPPPSVGGTLAAGMVAITWPRWGAIEADERPHLLAEAQARIFADRARWMQPNGWSTEIPGSLIARDRLDRLMADYVPTRHIPLGSPVPPGREPVVGASFVVLDGDGSAVACGVGTGGLFGAGLVAPGTGIVLAIAPGPGGPPPATATLVINPHTQRVHFAAAASGGPAASGALTQTLLATESEDRPLAEAVALPRLVAPGTPDAVFLESGMATFDPAPLTRRGHQTGTTAMPSRVEALRCRDGQLSTPECETATDPRGFGLATIAGKNG